MFYTQATRRGIEKEVVEKRGEYPNSELGEEVALKKEMGSGGEENGGEGVPGVVKAPIYPMGGCIS